MIIPPRELSPEFTYRRMVSVLLAFILTCLILPIDAKASTKEGVLKDAAEYFVKEAVGIPHGKALYVGKIINRDSRGNDMTGKDLENDLFFALEALAPDFNLILEEKPTTHDDIQIIGSYQLKGTSTILRLKVVRGIKSETVLATFQGEYQSDNTRNRMLVAILDLEAAFLDEMSRKAFSEIMRGAFSKKGTFDIVNSADVDKLDSDAIQKASGCTRDECATIIGEQLGVDRVVSSSIYRVNDDLFVISGKIINIRDGAIVKSRTVKHNGKLDTLDSSVEGLVDVLTTEDQQTGAFVRAPSENRFKDSKNRFQEMIEPFLTEFTDEMTTAFSGSPKNDPIIQQRTFNIDTFRFGGPGLSWTNNLDENSHWTTGIAYAPALTLSGEDDLVFHTGYKYLFPLRLAIFNFHLGGSLVLSRNDGLRNPYFMMGTDFLFMYMGFDIPTSKANHSHFYFGFKFEY